VLLFYVNYQTDHLSGDTHRSGAMPTKKRGSGLSSKARGGNTDTSPSCFAPKSNPTHQFMAEEGAALPSWAALWQINSLISMDHRLVRGRGVQGRR